MNIVGVGISKETDPNLAIDEVIKSAVIEANLPVVNWILIFFTSDHFENAAIIHKLIIEKTNCKNITGCSGMGVIWQNEEITSGPGLVLMAGYTPELKPLALAKIHKLYNRLNKI